MTAARRPGRSPREACEALGPPRMAGGGSDAHRPRGLQRVAQHHTLAAVRRVPRHCQDAGGLAHRHQVRRRTAEAPVHLRGPARMHPQGPLLQPPLRHAPVRARCGEPRPAS
eukprot:430903-Prorocentrum_minimum.AAC.1